VYFLIFPLQSTQFREIGFGNNVVATAGAISTALGTKIKLIIDKFSSVGTHGFSVLFYNVISSIKFHPVTLAVHAEDFQVLDPLPVGTGEWVSMMAAKWDYNWVSKRPCLHFGGRGLVRSNQRSISNVTSISLVHAFNLVNLLP
jgi:hypothetical protein